MSEIFHHAGDAQKMYWDRQNYSCIEDQVKALQTSSTIYVGNLDFATTEQMIFETFRRVGAIKRVIMGINAETRTPCGFCFVEFFQRQSALDAVCFLSGTVCDSNVIRCELDAGFKPGRQIGRGAFGGQTRDDVARLRQSDGFRRNQKRKSYPDDNRDRDEYDRYRSRPRGY